MFDLLHFLRLGYSDCLQIIAQRNTESRGGERGGGCLKSTVSLVFKLHRNCETCESFSRQKTDHVSNTRITAVGCLRQQVELQFTSLSVQNVIAPSLHPPRRLCETVLINMCILEFGAKKQSWFVGGRHDLCPWTIGMGRSGRSC